MKLKQVFISTIILIALVKLRYLHRQRIYLS